MSGPRTIETGYAPIKAWIDGVPVEDEARRQLFNIAALPFVFSHVAVMPDVHLGKGATVGSVIPTAAAIMPAAVGVDIGCGMMAVRTTLTAERPARQPAPLRAAIEAAVPHGGVGREGALEGRRAERRRPAFSRPGWPSGLKELDDEHPAIREGQSVTHLGTLGGGNHFIEVCLDEDGPRLGHAALGLARHRQRDRHASSSSARKQDARATHASSCRTAISPGFEEGSRCSTTTSRRWPGRRSSRAHNREVMMAAVLRVLREAAAAVPDGTAGHQLPPQLRRAREPLRRARLGDAQGRGAGAARASSASSRARWARESYIVRGKGNPESFASCSHGAGRAMCARRGQAALHAGRSRARPPRASNAARTRA